MIAIDHILVSDEVISEQFVCDLNKCKGGCCEDGDSGAPLTDGELSQLREFIDEIKPYCTPEGAKVLEKEGLYRYDAEFGWVTPTIEGRMCAYGYRDAQGIIKCVCQPPRANVLVSHRQGISSIVFFIPTAQNEKKPIID